MTQEEFRRRWRGKILELGFDTFAALKGDKLTDSTAVTIARTLERIDALIDRMHADITKPNGEKK